MNGKQPPNSRLAILGLIESYLTKKIASNQPLIIAIAGGTCSGKSTLAKKLTGEVAINPQPIVVPLDNYFKDIDDPTLPRTPDGRKSFDSPDSYHHAEYVKALRDITSGKKIFLPEYDTERNQRRIGRQTILEPAPVIIAEGLFAIDFVQTAFQPPTDISILNIFIEVDESVCLQRRIARDTERFKIEPGRVREVFSQKILPCYKSHVLPQKEKADIVVGN
jgi:uridine kinase